jgi:hypothetical protein
MPTTAELERQKQERLTLFQARYDSILEPLKRAAAPPSQGIGVNEYRRRSLGFIQQFLPPESKWRGVSLDGCKMDALNAIEPQILDEAPVSPRPQGRGLLHAQRVYNDLGHDDEIGWRAIARPSCGARAPPLHSSAATAPDVTGSTPHRGRQNSVSMTQVTLRCVIEKYLPR